MMSTILPFIEPGIEVKENGNFFHYPIPFESEAIKANAYYFGHKEWAEEYLKYVHREETFKSRWRKAMGNYTGKVVVDIGCGPGNLFASIEGKPGVLIGVDIAPTSLQMAAGLGYIPVLADATKLPFVSNFADRVTLNAALHHCEDMEAVLREAARLVKPGGLIIIDHDPQLSAWDYKGIAKLLWNARLWLYKLAGKGFHKTDSQQYWGLACEIHHKPGHGVTNELFHKTLDPMGFNVTLYPHNNKNGGELMDGRRGIPSFKYIVGNLLSGRNPFAATSAIALMCVAQKE